MSLSAVPTLQVGQAVTHIDSNGSFVPVITTKVTIFNISVDPMYLIEGTLGQYHQTKIDSIRELSYPKVFLINSATRPLHANTAQTPPAKISGFDPH